MSFEAYLSLVLYITKTQFLPPSLQPSFPLSLSPSLPLENSGVHPRPVLCLLAGREEQGKGGREGIKEGGREGGREGGINKINEEKNRHFV